MYIDECDQCKHGQKCEHRKYVEETFKGMIEYVNQQKEKYDLGDFRWSANCGQYFSKEGSSYRSGPEGTFW